MRPQSPSLLSGVACEACLSLRRGVACDACLFANKKSPPHHRWQDGLHVLNHSKDLGLKTCASRADPVHGSRGCLATGPAWAAAFDSQPHFHCAAGSNPLFEVLQHLSTGTASVRTHNRALSKRQKRITDLPTTTRFIPPFQTAFLGPDHISRTIS